MSSPPTSPAPLLFPGRGVGGRLTRLEYLSADTGELHLLEVGERGPAESGGLPETAYPTRLPAYGEHARGRYTRPLLRGHRVLGGEPDQFGSGLDWSPLFTVTEVTDSGGTLVVLGTDPAAGLSIRTEFEALPGGSLRGRHAVTNTGPGHFLVDGLEVVLPVGDLLTESLDFTGRHEGERTPQRRPVTDGLWQRESRGGRPGLDAATVMIVGTAGFDTTHGEVVAAHVAWSGNTTLRVERSAATGTTLGGGELLLPGEVALASGETYTTPWVHFAAADDGLDDLAARFHHHQRSLAGRPGPPPVTLNVWEAVFFDHDEGRLRAIADRAAQVGVERFVLDDGWFAGRRDDTAGLGDWWVDERIWPEGLTPLIDHVRGLGMSFGLWFEPEMVNPDSDLYREHPDWILATGGRQPRQHRNQQVLDLSRDEVRAYLADRIGALLSAYPIEFVKWDHNRDLTDAGSALRGGAAAVHLQTLGFYTLLDRLRAAHPQVTWEGCASGGGRIDLALLERVQRIWTSDMTDALARQRIQYWTAQLVAPELMGAHVSGPTSGITGRTFGLDFRAATALFGAFGIEWDLTEASPADLVRLAAWVDCYRRHRDWMCTARLVRPVSSDEAVLLHGLVAADRDRALVAHVQLDESAHNRGVRVRVPGLDPAAAYELAWEMQPDLRAVSMAAELPEEGPSAGHTLTGAVLGERGFWMPRRRPETITLVALKRRR